MKKFLTFALVCCLVFSSSSTVFATATQWDTSDQANLRYIYQSVTSGGSLYTLVNNIYTRVNTISNTLTDIKGYLFDSNHGIAYWVHAIDTFMNPIYTAIQNTPTELESIKRLLGYVSYEGDTEVIDPYLAHGGKGVAQIVSELGLNFDELTKANTNYIYNNNVPWSTNIAWQTAHAAIGLDMTTGLYPIRTLWGDNTVHTDRFKWSQGSPIGNVAAILLTFHHTMLNAHNINYAASLNGYNNSQTFTLWNGDSLTTSTFTPSSQTNGLYTWLSKIQEPVARLSYVLASDQDIEAREKAADNQAAVVDNFIDSSGPGATSTSDIGSVSDLSSGFKDNISTDASVSGIWNIFNADNFGWFSQETADQLDTSGSGNRMLKNSGSYPTPLLDQQTEDILKYIGGETND